jgi:adenine-specific DNA-methyltransferase
MCQESLINYLATELKSKLKREDIETLIKYGETAVEHETELASRDKETKTYFHKLPKSIRDNVKTIDKKLANIRVCDPAVGSGAFLVGMMNEIIKARNALTPFFKDKKDRTTYNFKRHAIQNCLYGVDIDPGAVEIAKLRLWLSLVVDEEDIKQIKPLPNLDYKIVCGNSLLGVEKNLFNANLFNKLEELKPFFFNETNAKKKQEYKRQIDDLITQITSGRKNFDFEIYFSEVFHEKGGFDVVIANPPYVKEYVNRNAFDGLRNSSYYQGKMDLWYMFACRGIDLVRNEGVVTFIAQNNWVTSYGASKMRDKVIQDTQILNLLDFGDFKVFETAGIQTMVMMFKKDNSQKEYAFDYRKIINESPALNDVIDLLNKNENKNCQYLKPFINREKLFGKSLVFSDFKVELVLNRIAQAGNFKFDPIKEVAQGIVCPQDYVNKTSQNKLSSKYKIGTGIFIIKNTELEAMNLSNKELYLIKPFYTTKELHKWSSSSKNKKWVIYTDSSFKDGEKIKKYPKIKEHLDKFKKVITSDNGPYGLHRARDERFFKGEKIIVARKCKKPSFTYTDFDSYVSATFYIIKTKRLNQKYLTGLLNSKLVAFWLKHRGKMQGNNYQIDKQPILEIPLIKPKEIEQKRISKIVDKILSITKDGDYLNNPTKQAKVHDYEKQIDRLVYKLYGLTEEEIKIVESSF